MINKDKIGHSVVNGHTIHEIKDDYCIICFENEIKQRIIKKINHFQEKYNLIKTSRGSDPIILAYVYGILEKLKEEILNDEIIRKG